MNNSANLLKYVLCYTLVFILTWIAKRNKSNRLFNSDGVLAKNTGYLIALHVAGIVWLGVVPITLFKISLKAFLFGSEYPNFLWLLLIVLLLPVMAATAFKESNKIYIKHKNIGGISNNFFSYYFFVRILFLCAYELFFRGILLFACIEWIGVAPAIILTTGLTVLIHVFTNKKEMWGCIPFGIILCICCIALNAVWPAIVLHLALSLAFEIPLTQKFIHQLKFSK